MITIDQLLESVDLDFEPRWITKGKLGEIWLWVNKPHINPGDTFWSNMILENKQKGLCRLKLAEFADKDWQECIYEVPRKDKPVVKIEKLQPTVRGFDEKPSMPTATDFLNKINELVDAVNELKETKNENI